ncbi:MAG: hypothetical protein KC419_15595 [Anaerolineales bacterium]|nr:hypothetical protein [Anaerolineales bacterium]
MNDLLIPLGACFFVVTTFVVLGFVAVKMSNKAKASWKAVEEQTGLFYEHTGIYPKLSGRLHGVDTAVDVITQQVASGSQYGSRSRAWTRVRAQLEDTPLIQVRVRQQQYDVEQHWQPVKTGDAVFDEKFELFVAEHTPLEKALPQSVKEALLAADPPVHILNNVVLWTKLRVVRDPELLTKACESCAAVAAAFEQ